MPIISKVTGKKDETINLLCTSSGSLGAFTLLKSFELSDLNLNVHITDIKDNVPMEHFLPYHKVPSAKSPEYMDALLEICQRYSIDALVPLHTDELPIVAKNEDIFRNNGVVPVVSTLESIENSINKSRSYDVLKENGFAVPDYYVVNSPEDFKAAVKALRYPEYPVCVKPSRYPSGGGRGFRILDPNISDTEIQFFHRPSSVYDTYEHVLNVMQKGQFPELMVMEHLPGEEYSVYVLAKDGEAIYIVPNKRIELLMMYSSVAEIDLNEEIIDLSRRITKLFGFSYNINIQIKYNRDGIPKVVEINPRIAGTIILPVAAGLNFPVWAIKLALGMNIPMDKSIPNGMRLERYWAEIFTCQKEMFQLNIDINKSRLNAKKMD